VKLRLIRSQVSTKKTFLTKYRDAGQNAVANFFNGLIVALMSGGEKAAVAFAIAAAPQVFAIPVIGQMLSSLLLFFLGLLGGMIDKVVEKTTDTIVIDIQVNGELSTVMQSGTALQLASAGGDPNAIADAKIDASNALTSLIKLDGWGTVT